MKQVGSAPSKKDKNGRSRQYALFFCEFCENTVEKRKDAGSTALSCGCFGAVINNISVTSPRKLFPELHARWVSMRGRCGNKTHQMYKRYGGRGIFVCAEWSQFRPFFEWSMQNGYDKKLQIDRIDNNGPYCPENCRWVSAKVNTRNTSIPTLNEEKVKTIRAMLADGKRQKDIAAIFCVTPSTISSISTRHTWSEI